jgi:glutamyl-tRNA reductase
VGTVVADLARRVFGSLGNAAVALIGAGEVAELVVKSLASEEAEISVIVNRSLASARRLCSAYGGRAVALEDAGDEALGADILVTSVSAQGAIVTPERIAGAVRARRGRPMLLVDLGVPRNVAPGVAELDGVILYDIDDLQHVVAAGREYRLEQADAAGALIAEETGKLAAQLRADEVAGTISSLCSELARVGESECARTLRRLGELTEEQREEVGRMAHRIVRKMLHSPIEVLKDEARRGNGAEMERSVKRLFRI